jgi:hypothetical protein
VEFFDRVSLLDDFTNKFMATDEIRGALEMATVEVQVTAAERGAGDFQDGISGLLDLGVGAIFYRNLRRISVESVVPSERRIGTL